MKHFVQRCAAMLMLVAAVSTQAAEPVFKAVAPLEPGASLSFPADFGAHTDYKTEWWYVTGWLNTADGKPLGFQVTFFRSATQHDRANPSQFAPKQLIIGHAAVSDPANGKLLHDQRSAREGFGLSYVKVGDTDVKLEDWRMKRAADGSYQVHLDAASFKLELKLTPSQPLLLQGDRGYSRKGAQLSDSSYYYSQPQLTTTGTVTRAGQAVAVTGASWLDHEWSTQYVAADAAGWDWIGANLADGGALMAFQMRSKTGAKLWSHATWRDASGKITQFSQDQVSFTPQRRWRSPRTKAEYPVATQLTTGSTVWQVVPLQDDQELDSRRSVGAVYWEGAVTLARDGKPAGRAYLEMTGYVGPIRF
ncbi:MULTISPECIES: lipocalin-like domain-containing protein [unclassified Duganella]|uniref:lipocalin-like domain-containing protein n=1 Tax=unclassified Duganella TaxID=2636909 RepID=UPI000E34C4AE|nr:MULTISPECIES: lipocalin-like domain-containing protein [unclassified Duganella]RFP13693.1 carotenoid 1,2-hydratase [Duganella sp. BJB475]RFP36401.1 carotenoid 1,2-hydratase [Duganella sp. BJB476]